MAQKAKKRMKTMKAQQATKRQSAKEVSCSKGMKTRKASKAMKVPEKAMKEKYIKGGLYMVCLSALPLATLPSKRCHINQVHHEVLLNLRDSSKLVSSGIIKSTMTPWNFVLPETFKKKVREACECSSNRKRATNFLEAYGWCLQDQSLVEVPVS